MPLPLPVRGKVRVYPSSLSTFSVALDDGARHRWGPLAACARVEVEMHKPAMRWSGHAYLDSNEGDEPIENGFHHWDWSRSQLRDGSTAVIYDMQWPDQPERVLSLRFGREGQVDSFQAPPRQKLPSTLWRVKRNMRSPSPVKVVHQLEDTPFYQRALLQNELLGETVHSFHESLSVPRLVSPIVRSMLPWRMPRRA